MKKWREDVAEIADMERYQVMHTRTLLEIAHFLPQSLAELKKIKGIGAVKTQQFGADLIAIIQAYCTEHQIQTDRLPGLAVAPEKAPKVDTKMLSLELFQAGKTLDEIAEERNLVRGTIEGHLAHFVALGELDIFSLLDREQVQEIEQFFLENRLATNTEAKTHFGEKYSYGDLRLVRQYLGASTSGDD